MLLLPARRAKTWWAPRLDITSNTIQKNSALYQMCCTTAMNIPECSRDSVCSNMMRDGLWETTLWEVTMSTIFASEAIGRTLCFLEMSSTCELPTAAYVPVLD